tara:strand:+ start:179 stop:361 length:183 start_codon:yes stop_codon:yes gene_type:complete
MSNYIVIPVIGEMVDEIAAIDIEIEACEIAIQNAYARTEVYDLEKRIQELLQKRRGLENA